MKTTAPKKDPSPLIVIFTTVFLDLIGFGMIIPLVGIYGRHFGATTTELVLLGSIYSIMQFFFSPIWGRWSDRIGRRPILLMSLLGSAFSYFLFSQAQSLALLILSRALAGIFAANISTAQAYIADVTTKQDRAKGMGLIGAAFGIGFTLGPPVGGIAVAKIGLSAPGLIAGSLCFANFILAWFRLKESLSDDSRQKSLLNRPSRFQQLASIKKIVGNRALFLPVISTFFATFAFSNLEQVFSLLIQTKFSLETTEAGYQTGLVLMWSGFLGALIQGGLIRKLVPKYGEVRLVIAGLLIQGFAMILFSHSPTYAFFFYAAVPLALGSGLLNPSLAALVSKNAAEHEQGEVIGIKESLSSLARIFGPFCGLFVFTLNVHAPFYIGGITVIGLAFTWMLLRAKPAPHQSR